VADITNVGINRHQNNPKDPLESDVGSPGEPTLRFRRPVASKPPNDFNGFNWRAENSINLWARNQMTDLIARLTVPNRP
jgi:hypothetical protein